MVCAQHVRSACAACALSMCAACAQHVRSMCAACAAASILAGLDGIHFGCGNSYQIRRTPRIDHDRMSGTDIVGKFLFEFFRELALGVISTRHHRRNGFSLLPIKRVGRQWNPITHPHTFSDSNPVCDRDY